MATSEHAINPLLSTNFNLQTDAIYELGEIAAKVALNNFEWSFITLVYFNSTWLARFSAEIFLRSYEKCAVIGKGTSYPKFVGKTRQYVLFEYSVNDLLHTLELMRDQEFDNTGKYIIICLSLDMHECNEALAMQALWEYKITNVVFLKSIDNEATGFTYFPLNNKSCIYNEPVRLVNLTLCLHAIDFHESCNLYPLKLGNLNACPLTVSTFQQQPKMKIENGVPSGSDGDLLRLIVEKLNANLTVMTPLIGDGWGKLEPNGTWSGSLADVYYDYANFSMTSAALTLPRFSFFHLSIQYNEANVAWFTHPATIVPSSLKLAYPFQENARIALVVSFAIVVMCSLIFHTRCYFKLIRQLKIENSHSSLVFYSWMICMGLGVPTTRLPTKTALLHIVLLWIWYCFLVRTFYQVSLIPAMKSNYYYKEFETIEDAIYAEYSFGGGAALKDYFIDYPKVYNSWEDVETLDIIPTLRKISQGMKFVLAMGRQTAKTTIWNEKISIHMLPQKVVTTPSVIFFKKFSPLADPVNGVLIRLTESGFTEKFYKTYVPIVVTSKTHEVVETIKLEHYTGCYAIIITGWVVSFMLFVTEMTFDKIYNHYATIDFRV